MRVRFLVGCVVGALVAGACVPAPTGVDGDGDVDGGKAGDALSGQLTAPSMPRTEAPVPGAVDAPHVELGEPSNDEKVAGDPVGLPHDPASRPRSPYRVDNRIIESRSEAGVLENASNSWLVQFRPMSEGGVRLVTFDGDELEFSAVTESDSTPTIGESGTSVTYEEVWPGVDVEYLVSDSRVEEVIVAKRDPGRSDFDFELVGGALRPRELGGFEVFRSSKAGFPADSTGIRLNPVTVTDGAERPIDPGRSGASAAVFGERPVSRGVDGPSGDLSTVGSEVESVLRVSVSPDLFSTADLAEYPIRIDPSADMPESHLGVDEYSSIQQGVNLATGNYTAEELDASIPAVGPDLEFRRTYNSIPSNAPMSWFGLGFGWTSNLSTFVMVDPQTGWSHLFDGDGQEMVFVPSGAGTWESPPGSTLVMTGTGPAGLVVTDLDGSRLEFATSATYLTCFLIGCPDKQYYRIESRFDSDGHEQRFEYLEPFNFGNTMFDPTGGASPYVKEVIDVESGRRLRLHYSDVPGVLHSDFKMLASIDEAASAGGPALATWTYVPDTNLEWYGYIVSTVLRDVYGPDQTIGDPHTNYSYEVQCGNSYARLKKWWRADGGLEAEIGYQVDCESATHRVTSKKNGEGDTIGLSYVPGEPGAPEQMTTTMLDGRGHSTEWGFDGLLRLTRRKAETGTHTRYWSYTPDDGNPNTIDGLLAKVVHEDGVGRDTFTYWPTGRVRSHTDRYGSKSWYKYDSLNRLTEERDPRSASESDNTYLTTTTYPSGSSSDMPASVDPPAPLTATTHSYTTGAEPAVGGGTMPAGLVKQTVDPAEGTTTYSYEADGDLAVTVDGNGLTTTYTYDGLGHELTRTETGAGIAAGATWVTTYDTAWRVKTLTEPVVVDSIDNVGRQKRTTNTYDGNGWLRTVVESDVQNPTTPTRTTLFDYDLAGRDKSKSTTNGTDTVISTTEYDGNGNVTASIDENGNRYEQTYDTRNNPDLTILKSYQDDPVNGSAPYDLIVKDEDYDTDNRKVAETDAEGRRIEFTSFTYGGQPRVVTLKDFKERSPAQGGGSGAVTDLNIRTDTFDRVGNLLTSSQGNGLRNVRYTYEPAGLKKSEEYELAATGAIDKRTEWTYNGGGNVLAETQKAVGPFVSTDRETRTVYVPGTGRVARSEVEMGPDSDLVTSYGYNARAQVITTTDPEGAITTVEYDLMGRMTNEAEPSVAVEENGVPLSPASQHPTSVTGYDVFGNEVAERDPNGNLTTSRFDYLDRVVEIVHPSYTPPGGTAIQPTEEFTYDNVGNLTSKKGRQTTNPTAPEDYSIYAYNRMNKVVRASEPSLSSGSKAWATEYTLYDRVGNATQVTDPNGAVTTSTYDMVNRVRSETKTVRQPSVVNATTFYDYDRLGHQTWTMNPRGHVSTRTYNSVGQKTSELDYYGWYKNYILSPFGETLIALDQGGHCKYDVYDRAGRQVESSEGCIQPNPADWATTQIAYDKLGQPTTITSPEGRPTSYEYDDAGQRTSTTVGTGTEASTTEYFYDPAGNVTRVRNGRGNDTIIRYQSWNLEQDRVEPATRPGQPEADRTWTTSYDSAGQPVTDTQPGAVRVDRTFDPAGHVRSETAAGAPGSRVFDYDVSGRLTTASSPAGAITVSYNDRNQPLAVSGGNSTATFTYESWGGLASVSSSIGVSNFTYDANGNVKTQTDPITGGTAHWTYDRANRPIQKIRFRPGIPPTNMSSDPGLETFDWDAFGRLTHLRSFASYADALAGTADHDRKWVYDKDALVTSETVAGSSAGPDAGTQTYGYTSLGQLREWTQDGQTTIYGYDKAGNRDNVDGSTYVFDDQNRLTSGGGTTYSWTDRGTLESRTTGGTTTSYDFDAFGQELRAGTVDYERDALGRISSRDSQQLHYQGLDAEVTDDGHTKAAYTTNGEPLSIEANSQAAWAMVDIHTDLVALIDPTTGEVKTNRTYDPWGDPGASNGTMTPRIGYQSDWTDPTTDEVNMGARHYLPASAGFTSRDTYAGRLETPISLNRYTYAHNNPLTNLDPTGNAVDVNPYTMSAAEYMRAVHTNINEYKRNEFLGGIANGQRLGYSSEKIQFLLALHFREVVDPNVSRIIRLARARWERAHPRTTATHAPIARVNTARRISAQGRLGIVEQFFTKHSSGPLSGPSGVLCGIGHDVRCDIGVGMGILGFLTWEIESGRIQDGPGGSPWWEAVNGLMIMDLWEAAVLVNKFGPHSARGARRAGTPGARAWYRFASNARGGAARGVLQRQFWTAHQESLHYGLRSAAHLIPRTGTNERAFIETVIENVDLSALNNLASDNFTIGAYTNTVYPKGARASRADLDRTDRLSVRRTMGCGSRSRPGIQRAVDALSRLMSGGCATLFGNVGLWSTRWS